ncbi:pseudouridylate synthase TRUB2, mitochondrial [Atheta coriaria]|uniref:pseudouridylate synthase TRUB2, mitochondrial n=1 Tax=Dalotia coriaria TaxID=877792 RepID=UPI0031F3F4C3
MLVKSAPLVWNQLKGIICVNKPADMTVTHLRGAILTKISQELNELEVRPPMDYVSIDRNASDGKYDVVVKENLADHPLVVGPRYLQEDIPCSWSNYLGSRSSGVLLLGIRTGTKMAKHIRENHPTRAYRVKGILGQATDDFFKTGKVVERSTFRHVKLIYLERLLYNMQASHQRKMFEMCGVDMQSQAAYELAAQGLLRPKDSKIPVIYGINCVDFSPPEFTIEIQCVNEYEKYLAALIHEIGIKLHSTAHCTGIKCVRHSHFTLEHALLRKQWDLQNIITNMESCSRIINDNESILRQKSVTLQG